MQDICVINSWSVPSGIGIGIFSKELGSYLTLLNMYGTSQIIKEIWDKLLGSFLMRSGDFVLGEDLNFSLGFFES